MRAGLVAALLLSLAACGSREDAPANATAQASPSPAPPSAAPSASPASPSPAPSASPATASACLMQDGERLKATRYRAVGTEPFWGAAIEGRCVTYSHPEDQAGTRVWTRHVQGPDGESWSGALGGRPFVLRMRKAACSDGMSDTDYPMAVELAVGGETRTGCAAGG